MNHRQTINRFVAAMVFLATLATAPLLAQTTWYVDDDAPNDPGPGDPTVSDPMEDGSPEHPFDAIQEGIDAAVDGDVVEIADGTYTGTGNRDLDFGGKAITVRGASGDPTLCIINCEGSADEPHRGFYFHTREGPDSVVEALTITNGYRAGDCGGGVYCLESSKPTLVNCRICGNYASFGGGVHCRFQCHATLINCTISDNSAKNIGGGVVSKSSNPTLTNCTISGNSANMNGGGIAFLRGDATLNNCTISGNSANDGGGIYCYGRYTRLNNCTITENQSLEGGGLYCHYSGPQLNTDHVLSSPSSR